MYLLPLRKTAPVSPGICPYIYSAQALSAPGTHALISLTALLCLCAPSRPRGPRCTGRRRATMLRWPRPCSRRAPPPRPRATCAHDPHQPTRLTSSRRQDSTRARALWLCNVVTTAADDRQQILLTASVSFSRLLRSGRGLRCTSRRRGATRTWRGRCSRRAPPRGRKGHICANRSAQKQQ